MGSVQKMLHAINNNLFKDYRNPAPKLFNPSVYAINKDSTFFDIGHGTGKVVMHVALEIGCKSKGIEINEVRYDLSQRLKQLLLEQHEATEWGKLVDLQLRNVTRFQKFHVGMDDASHIFCFDKVFSDHLIEKIMTILNNTKFKIFVSSWPH